MNGIKPNRLPGGHRRVLAGAMTVCLLSVLAITAPEVHATTQARRHLKSPDSSQIAAATTIRDTIVHRRDALPAHSAQAAWGGVFGTADGSQTRILLSPAYVPDPVVAQNFANLFAGFIHRDELNSLTVYIAPYEEMQADCGGDRVVSCYDPRTDTIVLLGESLPGGPSVAAVAAHEYGHHVANHRNNSPWSAVDWGPKYWATYENVCLATHAGQAFPGDEGENYTRNPGEAWAETYRVLNAQDPFSWPILDDFFAPDATALGLARRDVLEPWDGNDYTEYSGRLSRRHPSRLYRMPVENDGTIDVKLRSRGSLDADLYIYRSRGGGRPLARSVRGGHRDRIRGSLCGLRHAYVAVIRNKGTGLFTVDASLPTGT